MRFAIVTFGCQMNKYDSEVIRALLEKEGFEFTAELEKADIVILNTCTVREKSENKAFGKLGKINRIAKRRGKKPLVVFGGCAAQRLGREVIRKTDLVDVVVGTFNLHRLPILIKRALKGERPVVEVWNEPPNPYPCMPVSRFHPFEAWVTIIRGCNKFCTYCIVPYVRGREISRSPAEVLDEVRDLDRRGYKLVTFLGQNVDAYGKDLNPRSSLAELLRMCLRETSIPLFWFTTNYPGEVTDDLIETVAGSKRIVKNFHLPVQHGDGEILRRMNRKYTLEEYVALVERVRKTIPDVTVTSDVIVGFPGETERAFLNLLEFLKGVRFDLVNFAMYSPRPGTPAARFPDQVSWEEKRRRLAEAMALQESIILDINRGYIGKTLEVLVEKESPKGGGQLYGRAINNKVVVFHGGKNLIGRIARVKIEDADLWALKGKLEGKANPHG